MLKDTWFRIGLIGTVFAAVCCFTSAAVVALGAIGLGAYSAWLDPILIPALLIFSGILVVAVIRAKQQGA